VLSLDFVDAKRQASVMNSATAPTPGALSSKALEQNRRVFRRLCEATVRRSDAGRFEAAANLAEVAAGFAWSNHPGSFASPQLESALSSIGRQAFGRRSSPSPSIKNSAQFQRVLHVFSQVYEDGGHTRLAARWIGADSSRRHDVVTTRPLGFVPRDLSYAVTRSGGQIFDLSARAPTLLERAQQLAEAVIEADAVILHSHPDDAVPSIALSALSDRPPVATVNHADHVFWLGACLPDVLVCFRPSGAVLAERRRGVGRDRVVSLPLPLPSIERRMSVEAAKDELSLPRDSILLLTVASEYKFQSLEGPSFLDLVRDEMLKNPSLVLVAVGPLARGPWSDLAKRLPDRVFPTGPVAHPFLYRHAADIYLDSFPFCSNTSLLESALLGTPVLAYTPERHEDSVVFADLESLGDVLRAETIDEYRCLLRQLADDASLRAELGGRLSRAVGEVHGAEPWSALVERVYAEMASTPRRQDNDFGEFANGACSSVDKEVVRVGAARDIAVATLEAIAGSGTQTANVGVARNVSLWTLRLMRVMRRLGVPERLLSLLGRWIERSTRSMLSSSGRTTFARWRD
jgi:hypothetical protein